MKTVLSVSLLDMINSYSSKRLRFIICLVVFIFSLQSTISGNLIVDEVHISEFMADNETIIQDEDGDYSDWIEIYNPTASDVNLLGWRLTDNFTNPAKWQFPAVTIPAGGYLIIFASNKNKTEITGNLHTNFKLDGSGEYLAMIKPDGTTITTSFGTNYPPQSEDISFGVMGDDFVYMPAPTPNAVNSGDMILPPPVVSVPRGFYDEAFEVTLSTTTSDVTIYYTTDGSTPDTLNGIEYTSPVNIATTTPLRAIATKSGLSSSKSVTCSYLFLNDVLLQPNDPAGYPSEWGSYRDIAGTAIADYEMDTEIVYSPVYQDLMIPSLLSIPTVSLVTDIGNLFSHDSSSTTGGIYIYTGPYDSYGSGWERPFSFEYIIPDSSAGFQVNCGVRLQGGASRQAEKTPKHSFRLIFRSEYGPGRLSYSFFEEGATDDFNMLVLRAGYGNTYRHFSPDQRERATHIRDSWAKDTQLDMGYFSAHNKFVHLYINGLYWGMYNLCERLDEEFMQTYYGGNDEDFDVVKDYLDIVNGDSAAFVYLCESTGNSNISNNQIYQRLIGNNPDGTKNQAYESYVDPKNLCDYMLLNFYGGNNDWDHHNWVAARNKVNPGKGFQFFCWDTEKILEDKYEDYTGEYNEYRPSAIFRGLMNNPEFRLLFADRVNLHLKNNGLLTPTPVSERWMERSDETELPIVSESARWGDYRRDVHQWMSPPYELYTRNDYWYTERDRLMDDYFPDRTQIVLGQLDLTGLLPNIDPPVFSQFGGDVPSSFKLAITANDGEIYYTTDDSDPRAIGGSLSANAVLYTDSVSIGKVTPVNARAKDGNVWSGITSAVFYKDSVSTLINPPNTISERFCISPSPFTTSTQISYSLPENSEVNLLVYSLDGKLIDILLQEYQIAGNHSLNWQPVNIDSGIYILVMQSKKFTMQCKIVYM